MMLIAWLSLKMVPTVDCKQERNGGVQHCGLAEAKSLAT